MAKFIELAVFTLQSDLDIVRSLLESEDIRCYVKDELTSQVYTFSSVGLGGIRLDVLEKDFEQAAAFLNRQGYAHFLSVSVVEKSVADLKQEAQLMHIFKWILKIVIVLAILAIALLFFKK